MQWRKRFGFFSPLENFSFPSTWETATCFGVFHQVYKHLMDRCHGVPIFLQIKAVGLDNVAYLSSCEPIGVVEPQCAANCVRDPHVSGFDKLFYRRNLGERLTVNRNKSFLAS